MKPRVLVLVVLAVLVSSCGGGGGKGGGPTSPTEPSAPKTLLIVDVALVPQSGGLEEASLTLDGREILHPVWSGAGGSCQSDCHLPATVEDVRAGSHTLEVTVIRQTRSRISYVVVGQVTFRDTSGAAHGDPLPSKIVTLEAGGKITYPVTL